MTVREFIKRALQEIGATGLSNPVDGSLEDLCYDIFKRMQDANNADRLKMFTGSTVTVPMVSGQASYTIGPSGADITTARPMSVVSATVMPVGQTQEVPLDPYETRQDLFEEPNKTIDDQYPTQYFYEPSAPNGTLTVWPVPTTAATVRLLVPTLLQAITSMSTELVFPSGYWDAWHLNFAVRLCRPLSRPQTPDLVSDARMAMALVHELNYQAPPKYRADEGRYDIFTNRRR